MRVTDPLGVEWEVSVRRIGLGERSFSPAGAEPVLPVSPLSSYEQRNVRMLP
jgi:hypothetical protein